MFNLSKKAAERFRQDWSKLPQRFGDFWKIDIFMNSRIPMLVIVHEYTLYTLIRRKSEFKSFDSIAAEVRRCCPWYKYAGDISLGKNSDRNLTGSITELKHCLYEIDEYGEDNGLELDINDLLYSYLSETKGGYGTPSKAVEKYKEGLWPPKVRQRIQTKTE